MWFISRRNEDVKDCRLQLHCAAWGDSSWGKGQLVLQVCPCQFQVSVCYTLLLVWLEQSSDLTVFLFPLSFWVGFIATVFINTSSQISFCLVHAFRVVIRAQCSVYVTVFRKPASAIRSFSLYMLSSFT